MSDLLSRIIGDFSNFGEFADPVYFQNKLEAASKPLSMIKQMQNNYQKAFNRFTWEIGLGMDCIVLMDNGLAVNNEY